ncbi:hypothetical protein [Myxococcus landrumensis]|uniref:Uncharacterized protein n=1 Tax=Myxococcus landrumensis TaxID=2813577 RepID=A0ABX7NFT1_9BACT|nr:hypothetical protein [Myxococcus landrumus]QSQ17669.1 hypothetical protein JY572_17205 [Myxococcus landrumus]
MKVTAYPKASGCIASQDHLQMRASPVEREARIRDVRTSGQYTTTEA